MRLDSGPLNVDVMQQIQRRDTLEHYSRKSSAMNVYPHQVIDAPDETTVIVVHESRKRGKRISKANVMRTSDQFPETIDGGDSKGPLYSGNVTFSAERKRDEQAQRELLEADRHLASRDSKDMRDDEAVFIVTAPGASAGEDSAFHKIVADA